MTELPLILSAMSAAFAIACGVLATVAISRAAHERTRRLDAEERAEVAEAAMADHPGTARLFADLYGTDQEEA